MMAQTDKAFIKVDEDTDSEELAGRLIEVLWGASAGRQTDRSSGVGDWPYSVDMAIDWIEMDPVELEDVELAAMNYRDTPTNESLAYRNRLIAVCWFQGNVVWDYLVWATGLSKGHLRRIVSEYEVAARLAQEPKQPPWPIGKLRIVKDE